MMIEFDEVINQHEKYKNDQIIGVNDLKESKMITSHVINHLDDNYDDKLNYLITSHYSPIQEYLLDRHHLELFSHFINHPTLNHLLNTVSTSSSILSLSYVIKSNSNIQIKSKCSSLLSGLLLRPDGVSSLLFILLSSPQEFNNEKFIQVAKLLSTKPSNLNINDYLNIIVKNILQTLLLSPPTNHIKVISLSFELFLSKYGDNFIHQLNTHLITPFHTPNQSIQLTNALTYLNMLNPHSKLILNQFTNDLFPLLFNLGCHLDRSKTANPLYKSLIDSIFNNWSSLINNDLAIDAIWNALKSGTGWKDDSLQWSSSNPDGLIVTQQTTSSHPNLFNIHQSQQDELLKITPNPQSLATFVININRNQILGPILIKCLSQYHGLKDFNDLEPLDIKDIMKYLQFSTCLVEQMGNDILENKDDILAFIYHTLQIQHQSGSQKRPQKSNTDNTTKSLQDLLVFEDHNNSDTKNDDEGVDNSKDVDQILISTALNLLLATLEGLLFNFIMLITTYYQISQQQYKNRQYSFTCINLQSLGHIYSRISRHLTRCT